MPILARQSPPKFTQGPPAPEGPQQAVCVDIVDLGLIEQTWGEETKHKHMIRIIWHSSEVDPKSGQPYAISQRYTLSLDPKANLRKHLEAWRGRAFTEDELRGFDVESVIGANAFLSITQNISKGVTYANVTSIMKLPKGMTPMPITPGYIRLADKERLAATEVRPTVHDDAPPPDDDSDIPF